MDGNMTQLLVLAAIAVFLIVRLRAVLGTREGFEKPRMEHSHQSHTARNFEVIEGGPDRDIIDHVSEGSSAAKALAAMKQAEPSFNVSEFLSGARGAYEMILMGFERGDLAEIRPFLSDDVYESFAEVVESRNAQGITVDANFLGVSSLELVDAEFDGISKEGDVSVRFVGELTSVVRDRAGEVIEGDPNQTHRQRDTWTFSRKMGSDNPNWQLVATGE